MTPLPMHRKIAGVQVTSGTSIGSSSKVLLRGASSITGDNQPLFVVDGVPMDADYSSGNQQRSDTTTETPSRRASSSRVRKGYQASEA